jgi:hypothetical protein
VVERLLVRDRKKRVRLGELLRDDEWFREVGERSDFGFGFGMTGREGEGQGGGDNSLIGVLWGMLLGGRSSNPAPHIHICIQRKKEEEERVGWSPACHLSSGPHFIFISTSAYQIMSYHTICH